MDLKSQSKLTPEFVAQALGVAIPAGPTLETGAFDGVVTDSRKIRPGCLFIALKGEKFDAHEFIVQAVEQGARGVICRSDYDLSKAGPAFFFRVPSGADGNGTEAAYRKLGAAWRSLFDIPVVAVAGSVGKTTTKELLTAILRGKWGKVLKTEGSQNGFVGIPMTLLELRREHGAAVIEVGIDEIGAMEQHMPLVAPDAAILTAIGPEHLEKLIDLPTVAREEALALRYIDTVRGLTVINLDDPWIAPVTHDLKHARRVAFTLRDSARDTADRAVPAGTNVIEAHWNRDRTVLRFSGCELDGLELVCPLPGTHNARNLCGAVAMARGLGLTAEEIRNGLATFTTPKGRSEVYELKDGITVLCDYYNANPSSVTAGLNVLTDIAHRGGARRVRWACLGDMLELGTGEQELHRGLAPQIVALGIEHVFLYGQRMQWLQDELKKQGFRGELRHFDTHAAMAEALIRGVQPKDALMIKGSRSMKMEEVWKPFQAKHS